MSKLPKTIDAGNYDGIIVKQGYDPLVEKLQPLDFFCVAGNNFISKGIRFVTKNQSADRQSDYNHAGIFPDGSACTLEALWTLKSTNIFEHYEGCKILIARWNGIITHENYLKTLKETNKHIGQWYPTRRIALHLLNLAHIFHWSKSLVCSEYVAKVLYKLKARHSHFYGTNPDMLADEVHNQLNKERTGAKYQIVFEGELPNLYYKYCPDCKTYHLVNNNLKNCPTCEKPLIGIYINHYPSGNIPLDKKIQNYNKDKSAYVINN